MKNLTIKLFILLGLCLFASCQNNSSKVLSKSEVATVLKNKVGYTDVPDVTISVKYWDYQGNARTGDVHIVDGYQQQVAAFFDLLYKANFQIANLAYLGDFTDLGQAFAANATFTMMREDFDGNTDLVIYVNPTSNPIVLKDAQTTNLSATKFNYGNFAEAKFGDSVGNVKIFPARGLYSVNHDRAGQPNGAVHQAIVDMVENIGVEQILTEKNDTILYYGLFKFSKPAALATSKKATAFKQASVIKKDYLAKKNKVGYKNISNNKSIITLPSDGFSYGPLPDDVKKYLTDNNLWNKDCPVSMDRLSFLNLQYYDYDGAAQRGNLITIDVAAEDMLNGFKNLFAQKFPLEKVSYDIAADSTEGGTQSFNCRPITGGQSYSLHAYGTAIDVSWYRNPYIGLYQLSSDASLLEQYVSARLTPPYSSLKSLYRDSSNPNNNEQIKNIIQNTGFYRWGGDWHNPTDYMHFETSRFISAMIAGTDFNTGQAIYKLGIKYAASIDKLADNSSWLTLYKLYPTQFANAFTSNISLLTNMSEYQYFDYINGYLQSVAGADKLKVAKKK